jgi:hypothetical protein
VGCAGFVPEEPSTALVPVGCAVDEVVEPGRSPAAACGARGDWAVVTSVIVFPGRESEAKARLFRRQRERSGRLRQRF